MAQPARFVPDHENGREREVVICRHRGGTLIPPDHLTPAEAFPHAVDPGGDLGV